MLIATYVFYRSVVLSRRLRNQLVRERELMDINLVLDSRSRELDLQAKTDSLTGLLNRAGLEDALQKRLSDRRNNAPLSLILFDVDFFKNINDTHGHAQGDAALITLATVVRKQVRRHDVIARWGGEEFILVCQDTKPEIAIELAEKIRRLIEETLFAHGETVTASFGVATLTPGGSLETLFDQADAALYRAKHAGRNCVKSAEH